MLAVKSELHMLYASASQHLQRSIDVMKTLEIRESKDVNDVFIQTKL